MLKHTPGPWHVSGPTRDVKAPPTAYLPDGMVAATRYLGNAPEREAEHAANAALIAAAPDLLQAARMVMTWPSHENMTPVFDALRAAIAKAEGT